MTHNAWPVQNVFFPQITLYFSGLSPIGSDQELLIVKYACCGYSLTLPMSACLSEFNWR